MGVSGLTRKSANPKTGDMLQIQIINDKIDPVSAMKEGLDTKVCDDCPLRSTASGGSGGCYVVTAQAPLAIYRATDGDPVEPLSIMPNKPVRLGSYGDPSYLPLSLLSSLTRGRWTGYTHRWRKLSKRAPGAPWYGGFLMASVETLRQRLQAKAKGWRTFRVISKVSDLAEGEILCPNSTHGTTCSACGLCDGARIGDRRKDIAILGHGPLAGK